MSESPLFGMPIVVSNVLPLTPGPGVWARRYVRHGMADVLAWLGEDVGPKPDDETHALLVGNTVHASAAMVGRLRAEIDGTAPVGDARPESDPTEVQR